MNGNGATGENSGRPGPSSDGPEGVVYWITGLAGSGKTTLGALLTAHLRERGRNVAFLDGDELRATLFPALGYAPAERLELARCYGRLCALLSRQGIDVVCATISLFPEVWEANRRDLPHYREILVRAPADVRSARKGSLYRSIDEGGDEYVVGRDAPAVEPPHPELVLENDGVRSPAQLVGELVSRLGFVRGPR